MKFTVPVTFDIDPAEWAEEYDDPSVSEAIKHIVEKLSDAARPGGGLTDAIVSQWPMMRDAATVTAGMPILEVEGSSFPPFHISGCLVVSFTRLGQVDGMIPERGIAIARDGERYNVHSCAWDRKAGRWSSENGAYGVTWQRAHEIAQERVMRDVAP